MKRFFVTLITLLICAASVCSAEPSGAMRLGILPVFKASSVSSSLSPNDAEIATSAIYAGMINCADFELISRTDVDRLVYEHELAATGLVDASTAPAFGRMLGAEYLLITNVTGLISTKKSGKNYLVTARMSARIVEVESGRVVLAAMSSADSKVKVTSSLMRIGTNNVDPGLATEALEKASRGLVKELLKGLESKKRARR